MVIKTGKPSSLVFRICLAVAIGAHDPHVRCDLAGRRLVVYGCAECGHAAAVERAACTVTSQAHRVAFDRGGPRRRLDREQCRVGSIKARKLVAAVAGEALQGTQLLAAIDLMNRRDTRHRLRCDLAAVLAVMTFTARASAVAGGRCVVAHVAGVASALNLSRLTVR